MEKLPLHGVNDNCTRPTPLPNTPAKILTLVSHGREGPSHEARALPTQAHPGEKQRAVPRAAGVARKDMADFVPPPSNGADFAPPSYPPVQPASPPAQYSPSGVDFAVPAPSSGSGPESQGARQRKAPAEDSLTADIPQPVREVIDKNLPKGCTKIFRFAFYQQFFQCESKDVWYRILQSLIIWKGHFLKETAQKKPDLWFPVWNTLTLIFALFFTTAIYGMTQGQGFEKNQMIYFGSFLGVILSYMILAPLIMWLITYCTRYDELKYHVLVSFFAYSLFVLLPVCVLLPLAVLITTTVVVIVYCVAAAWSETFFITQLCYYMKDLEVDRGLFIGLAIAFSVLHAGVLVGLGCVVFILDPANKA